MATAHRTPPAPQPQLYRFSPLDFATLAVYVALAGFFVLAGELITPYLREIAPAAAAASYAINLLFYGSVGILALLAARQVVARDVRVLATRPWFTFLMVPATVVAMLVLTAVLVAAGGETQTSANRPGCRSSCSRSPSG